MKIGIVGLGLIGGSMAKAIKQFTDHTVYGQDLSAQVMKAAVKEKAIDQPLTRETIGECSLLLIALYPQAAVAWVKENRRIFSKNTLVVDLCGVKQVVCEPLFPLAEKEGFYFVGGHPMAGVEFSGFSHSKGTLFQHAVMILTPPPGLEEKVLVPIQRLCKEIGFSSVQLTTPAHHDRMIAFTSQLAHIASSAYIKSPAALSQKGYSAGSYKDMTRVARLNENMWTELFLENADPLAEEIECLMMHLKEYRDAIRSKDADTLRQLLREGRECKAKAVESPLLWNKTKIKIKFVFLVM